ncbi:MULTISPECIES: DUF2147 domain-containing protein [Sphingobacterium]|uniref:DUF2147 domain-containing protein n=1 Tax=Sphingobacterium litopenaei TaxID=2763500 RepID=A0ABR7YHJ5_9SPHI|nr:MULTISPECIES: DUF2147 domain-containing protein [Sphingobacterium]MBD1430797.1 DUF2147 domain-containing protein [Sphingobacterium litopenaei]NGM74099.1 DUF2147 domain-containing protein [Sphingobacterium sp. SGL-16]
MKKFIITCFVLVLTIAAHAQSTSDIVGKWTTIDDETGQAKSIVEIFKKSDGKYYGKILKLLQKPENDNCVNCKDDRKNKPLLGLEIIRDLKKEGNEFTGGTITDPKTGKTYKCTITRNGEKLNVRGYIGFSLIGRTQTWTLSK